MRNSLVDHHMKYVWVIFCNVFKCLKTIRCKWWNILLSIISMLPFLAYLKTIRSKIACNEKYKVNWHKIRKSHQTWKFPLYNLARSKCMRTINISGALHLSMHANISWCSWKWSIRRSEFYADIQIRHYMTYIIILTLKCFISIH